MQEFLSKLKKELRRFFLKLLGFFSELVRKIYFRRYYDSTKEKHIKRSIGSFPLLNEIGIFLVFPVSGILKSHIRMLEEMQKSGISPVLISNIPLNESDHAALKEKTSIIIERPNIGYDFGGYRDGVIEIEGLLNKLDRLWLLNDSVWLVPQEINWFDQARLEAKDFVGATSSFSILRKTLFGKRRIDVARYRSIIWRHDPNNSNFHYASYALSIGPKILRDSNFIRYWKKLDIRNDKKHTVRRGEIGLTQWVLENKYSHGATYEIDRLDKELQKMTSTSLDKVARELVVFKNTKLSKIKSIVLATDPNSEEGRLDRIGLILAAVARQGSAYALAFYLLRNFNFSFLKKSLIGLSSDGEKEILDVIDSLELDNSINIKQEAKSILRS